MMRDGFPVARRIIEWLMLDMSLQGVIRGKPVRTTMSDKAAPCSLDHVNRRLSVTAGRPIAATSSIIATAG